MRKTRMTALGLLLGLVACSALSCVTVVVEDVDVTWSVDGSTDPSVCQTYGIDYWVVSLENGIDPTQSGQIPCETAVWAARFNDVEEDFYDVTIAAYDVGGNLIGEASQLEDIDGSLPSPDTFDYDLSPDTFAGAPKINVFWNINGTVDGSATGPSWDTCAEVGAVEVAVTVDGDTVYVSGGNSRKATAAIRGGGRGDVTDTHLLWEIKKASKIPTLLMHDALLYCIGDGGIARCLRPASGEIVYEQRLLRIYPWASPIVAKDKIYVVGKGRVVVLAVGPVYEELTVNEMADGGRFHATPAVDGSKLLIRSDAFLYCVGR